MSRSSFVSRRVLIPPIRIISAALIKYGNRVVRSYEQSDDLFTNKIKMTVTIEIDMDELLTLENLDIREYLRKDEIAECVDQSVRYVDKDELED